MTIGDTLDPETSDLVRAAFEKSWQFVRTDPVLAHHDTAALRTQLTRHLEILANQGQRDLWRLANGAIGELRRERQGTSSTLR